ncbi:BTB/POZ domain-containing protein [Aspergillus clavatus NRRL 1]|uniref:BTB domain-containing protein n=1 Tax=Aspergillus clavatus (strain ATCC 1007 / CBS 513.65 / DSM 816 / NCTC 3887 / NRRL 1 / QM 1276 / 107) TaxID=344612 RepID=A1C5D4_ASPCL|nr:uncharacterized protein ACLA_003140 [Aspergillus clavatus NRRL 1]EAW14902.1 hypothetical protein ACLA_003140 [Aspergillus clavatus NRRL 1]
MSVTPPDTDDPVDVGDESQTECEFNGDLRHIYGVKSSIASYAFLVGNPKYSDFEILAGDKVFPAHKAIVCSQSEFFAKVFDSHFSVGSSTLLLDVDMANI